MRIPLLRRAHAYVRCNGEHLPKTIKINVSIDVDSCSCFSQIIQIKLSLKSCSINIFDIPLFVLCFYFHGNFNQLILSIARVLETQWDNLKTNLGIFQKKLSKVSENGNLWILNMALFSHK